MRACLDGREVPPWDVVEALLQDLGAAYGPAAAAAERERARVLHTAALTAYDARPGARDDLADRLDVMLREQRYAAERRAELNRLLAAAPSPQDAASLRLDLAWAHDDHDRARARCAELRARMHQLDHRSAGGRQGAPHASDGTTRWADHEKPAGPDADSPGGHGGSATARGPRSAEPWTTEPSGTSGPGPRRAADPPAERTPRPGEHAPAAHVDPGAPVVAGRMRAEASADHGDQAGEAAGAAYVGTGVPSGRAVTPSAAVPPAHAGQGVPAGAASAPSFGPAPSVPAPPAEQADPLPSFTGRGAPAAVHADPAGSGVVTAPPGPALDTPPAPAKSRKRRRGSARFAGMADGGGAAAVVPQAPGVGGRTPRGARFAGVADPAEPVAAGAVEVVDAGAGEAVAGAVEGLARLRREGRSGEAHALLVEVAQWPAGRFPPLAEALHRAGLDADWATLLWEAAALPAERLVAAADALAAAGRDADGRQMLRQGVARPAEQIGASVLRLDGEGREREVRALLDAYVRVRPPEEAVRCVGADPRRLVPLLVAAAQRVSDERRWDLVHALRVAGHTT
jgi:hypothetical protein